MDFNLFIIPLTAILTELVKTYIPSKHVPLIAIVIGLVLGVLYGAYYGGDLLAQGVTGLVYGASATGIYNAGQKQIEGVK